MGAVHAGSLRKGGLSEARRDAQLPDLSPRFRRDVVSPEANGMAWILHEFAKAVTGLSDDSRGRSGVGAHDGRGVG
jgi:hypothetical protein